MKYKLIGEVYIMTLDLKIIIAEKLRNARLEANLQRNDVEKVTNIDNRTIGHYETGRSQPKLEVLAALAKLYNKPIGYFFGEEDKPNNDIFIDKIIDELIEDGVLDNDFDFNLLDKNSQQLLLSALNMHILKTIKNKKEDKDL